MTAIIETISMDTEFLSIKKQSKNTSKKHPFLLNLIIKAYLSQITFSADLRRVRLTPNFH